MKVGIVGASGYVGGEVLRLLVSHPQVEVSMVTSRQYVGDYIHRTHPSLKGFTDMTYSELDYDKMSDKCDLVFTAVPHGTATEIVKSLYDELEAWRKRVNAGVPEVKNPRYDPNAKFSK